MSVQKTSSIYIMNRETSDEEKNIKNILKKITPNNTFNNRVYAFSHFIQVLNYSTLYGVKN